LNGASGIDVKRQLARSGVRLPVIFVTANDNDVTRRSIAQVGCVAYLRKPFTAKSLLEAIALADQIKQRGKTMASLTLEESSTRPGGSRDGSPHFEDAIPRRAGQRRALE
jgi:FixJ family two-component response regulator